MLNIVDFVGLDVQNGQCALLIQPKWRVYEQNLNVGWQCQNKAIRP